MFLQFLATLNQTYLATHSLVKRGEIYETELLKVLEELKKSEKLRKNLGEEVKLASGVKVTLENELNKLKAENMEL